MENKIVWLTGHSGAGKTTIARELQAQWPCVVLDGNEMRESVSTRVGFTPADREEHNYRVARLAGVLVKQTNVVVAVIAPLRLVRERISASVPRVSWVWVKRTLPERENHFYEPSPEYPVLDHDVLDVTKSVERLKEIIGVGAKKTYSLFIGRWQPLHSGHLALFDKVRREGRNICIAIRDTEVSDHNPFSVVERLKTIHDLVPDARLVVIPDIDEVVHGRKVGWRVREIRLDEETEAVSATEIRKKTDEKDCICRDHVFREGVHLPGCPLHSGTDIRKEQP